MEYNIKYKTYRNFSLVHRYRFRIWEDGRVSISRDTFRFNEKDKKLRELIDLTGFGCTCPSLKEAEKYIKQKEKWKDSADDLFDMATGEPKRKGVRREFLSEDKSKGVVGKARPASGSSIVWRPEDFRPLHPNF